MAAKYKKFLQLMYEQNSALFTSFDDVHEAFEQGEKEEQFHLEGRRVRDVVRDWERRLCRTVTSGQYSQYAAKLADKFWDAVRERYPRIDEVGLKKG